MRLESEKDELLKLADEADGLLTIDAVLEAARNETSSLHRHFTWDDTKAANEYRRWQARALIAKCRIVTESRPDVAVRTFVSLPSDRQQEGGGYRLTLDVLDDANQKAELMRDMRNRIEYWSQQASWLDMPVRKALDRFADAVNKATEQRPEAA
jgi:hypothetical protein